MSIILPNMRLVLAIVSIVTALSANAQLSVKVLPSKVSGQKAIVPIAMKNDFDKNLESARAAVFILDEQGKMLGQSTRWVIGGSSESKGLPAGQTNLFNFVVPLNKSVASTNITTKVTFTRVVLEGGKLADVNKDLRIQNR